MLRLTSNDRDMLAGKRGKAAQFAMQTLTDIGEAHGAERFVEIEWAHVASAYCQTQANIDFAAQLTAWNARVAVPTTLTACSINTAAQRPHDALAADLVRAYEEMGCEPTLSCAPYHARQEPSAGLHLAWCESSAVVYANSVLGARTNCYPEFVDMCAAIAGRVPEFGMHKDEGRRATLHVSVRDTPDDWLTDDWFFQSLGILIGKRAGSEVPVITGLPADTTRDQLRSLGSAAASAGSIDMFHAVGLTPEAPDVETAAQGCQLGAPIEVTGNDVRSVAAKLCTDTGEPVSAVCVGAPHFSSGEFRELARLLGGRTAALPIIASTSGAVLAELEHDDLIARLQQSGVVFVTGRCTYYAPFAGELGGHVMTNSAKWAWYAPASLGVAVTFASLVDCVEKAING